MPVKILPATGAGSVTVQAENAISSDFTLTLPGATGTLNMSGAVNVVPAGTAGSPSITTTGDTNTGIYFPAADTIGFVEGGVEVARFDSSGNFGISGSGGSSTNRLSLTYNGGTGEASIGPNSTGGSTFLTFGTSNSGTYAERARIDSSGTPMFNTTSQLIRSGETFRVQLNAGIASFITSTGNFPVIALRNSGTNGFMMAFNNATTECGTISSSGNNVAYNTSSDYRLKENIKAMTGALEKIAALKPVTFNWKSDGSDGQGFIAHELQSVVPDAVTGEKDAVDDEGNPRYQGVDTSFLVATLTAAIQELSAKLDAAVAEIEALKGAK
jgi:hypothetical protein